MSNETEKKRPSFDAFHVKDGPDDKSYFNKIGAAFAHKDGEGHTITLDAVPVDGRIVLRSPKERLEGAKSNSSPRQHDERER